ncbi:archaeal proteasome endopeptidase complex subunit alpha [Candidatus Woesearchaeota archaeon]|nr:archaeal proteasome endopeptidase complex subunit alpha [Candidatus Woesearchaeota archaeon]
MQSMSHQMMGYDRAITMFSPDGRLLQVEYAKKTVRQGSTAIGMVCSDGVLLVADKRIVDPLIIADKIEKIFQVDDHIAATASGILSDARVLIERAQLKAQSHKVTYDTPIDTISVVKDMCSLMQICTQSGGLRPFGVSVLVVGVDSEGPKLYETDPTGIFFPFKATAIGEGEPEIEEVLTKEYKPSMTIEDGLKLALFALNKVLDKDFSANRVDAAFVKNDDKKFTQVSRDKLDKMLKEAKKTKQ